MKSILILHNIRSAQNVGSMFRTADAAGVSEVWCCGYTPTPTDRFGRKRADIAKTALGAEEALEWKQFETTEEAIVAAKEEGYQVLAIEQHKSSVDYKKLSTQGAKSLAFVAGNEPEGITEQLLSMCDTIIEIPMKGMKESLNVSVATGVVLFRILDK